MRIVGGRFRGRAIGAPVGRTTRPTTDRVRESLFDILAHGLGFDFTGTHVVDLFAGSGALGLEALSRGAADAVFVDTDRAALACIEANAALLGVTEAVELIRRDAARLGPPAEMVSPPAGLAFLDPPYAKGLLVPALAGLAEGGWLAPGALCVAETSHVEDFTPPDGFTALDERAYGDTRILFLGFDGDG